ncbi:MAG TPA: hypothetical protein VE053_07640 [Allosphingosinicella sp.]|nr:hypothetical protein [Allosphingosinicella sp.]
MLILLAAAYAQAFEDPCPFSLVLKGQPSTIAPHTRDYIRCMTLPHLPIESGLAERLERCAPVRARSLASARAALAGKSRYRRNPGAAERAAAAPFGWIDRMATNFPGCETRLVIAGDGNRMPDAEN